MTPFAYVAASTVSDPILVKCLKILLSLPLIFIAAKLLHLRLLDAKTAETIVNLTSSFWPALSEQYSFMINNRFEADAVNYVLFALIFLFLICIFLLSTLVYYIRTIKEKKVFTWGDVYILAVTILGSYIPIFSDLPVLRQTSVFNFYLDYFGLYYIRQWILLTGVGACLIMILATLLTGASLIIEMFVKMRSKRGRRRA
jgi:hypothetical protein